MEQEDCEGGVSYNFNFTSSEIRDMEDYALSTNQEVGNVVYLSRALVNKEDDFESYFLNPDELPSFISGARLSSINEDINNESEWNVNVFPNPSKNNFFIYLMNSIGQIVLKQMLNKQLSTISLSHLPSGNYVYRIANDSSQLEYGKLIILKE